ncbi:diguanylate cyclase [Thermosyntropha sp.]|uniref:histidine kinase N-terminal 7TM domain-containing diguanylate cyclase n=1 Tax=Thermosyntropha sp. TaxID=2740820 RepID=UPI0025E078C3|nr:diguanylate cyclase [Thermosyntropha sp.]MBO8158161.1 diguanylate cyclase [Thermosyntropha sp.]
MKGERRDINTLGILSLLVCVFYIWLGVFALNLNPRSRANWLFMMVSVCLVIWSFGYAFFYSADDYRTAWMWFRISSIGWILLPLFLLLFGLELTGKIEKIKIGGYFLIFLLPFLELYKSWMGKLTAFDFAFYNYGTVEIIRLDNPWYWVHIFYYGLYALIMFILIYRWGNKSRFKREKMQAYLIISFGMIILVSGLITNLILPALKYETPGIAHFLGVFWAGGILYAVNKYKLMQFNYGMVAEDILSHINDMVFLLDHNFQIVKVNRRALIILKKRKEEVLGISLVDLVEEKDRLMEVLNRIKKFDKQHRRLNFVTSSGEKIPTRNFFTAVRDNFGDLVGIVAVSKDMRLVNKLMQEIKVRKEAEKELRYLSLHDPLTGLFNRAYFLKKMEEIDKDKEKKVGIIICDLDGLKEINDFMGHLAGDEFIIRAAEVIRSCVRQKDEVMRIGGDEFVIILYDVDKETIADIAEKIKERFTEEELGKGVAKPGISAGYALREDSKISADELFRQADYNMYKDKKNKKCREEQIKED